MLDDESTPTPDMTPQPGDDSEDNTPAPAKKAAKKAATRKTTAKKATAKRTTRKATAKKAAPSSEQPSEQAPEETLAEVSPEVPAETVPATEPEAAAAQEEPAEEQPAAQDEPAAAPPPAAALLFQAPDTSKAPPPRPEARTSDDGEPGADAASDQDRSEADEADEGAEGGQRRRRRRGGRRRRKNGDDGAAEAGGDDGGKDTAKDTAKDDTKAGTKGPGKDSGKGSGKGSGKASAPAAQADRRDDDEGEDGSSSSKRRRRRRRRQGEEDSSAPDDPENTVVRVRERRQVSDDEISSVTGSTRLEAKKQRRREGREAGRRRAPIVSEAEFLARREAVDRVMVVRQRDDLTQIGVLEDGVLVEHYVARESQTSLIGNVYLGRVQNVLPSMEAAFVDIGKGRNAVLYAGEVNWSLLGKEGQPRRIESALKSGQTVLVQVTKDPVGHKGARLTSQISLPGRYLVYLPGGQTSGISRKLPDTERNRLKNLLKEILPEDAGVIIRTAAEGASEDELRRDVTRLTARWDDIEKKVEKGQAPQMLYGEPDLMIKVIRDLFTEDFKRLVVSGDEAWEMVEGYVSHVAPDLMDRVQRWTDDTDAFTSYRLDEQIAKALERKVWLPSGGSLIIDRTEAMTVVDVNTGKFTGSGGNLEETVTKNNLEAAEEIVRQLRLRDVGGIIVVDFIDMVLESNRDLVLRRLVECLGRDRTRHQVAEVTSLGLVQMTRKRIGTGLLEAFSEPCEACGGRGLHVHVEPVEPKKPKQEDDSRRSSRRGRRGGDGADRSSKKDGADRSAKKQDGKPDQGPDQGPDKAPEPVDRSSSSPTGEPERAKAQPAEVSSEVPPGPVPARAQPAETPAASTASTEPPTQPSTEAPAATMGAPASQDGSAPATGPEKSPEKGPETGSGTGSAAASSDGEARPARRTRRRAASRPAGPPEHSAADTH